MHLKDRLRSAHGKVYIACKPFVQWPGEPTCPGRQTRLFADPSGALALDGGEVDHGGGVFGHLVLCHPVPLARSVPVALLALALLSEDLRKSAKQGAVLKAVAPGGFAEPIEKLLFKVGDVRPAVP